MDFERPVIGAMQERLSLGTKPLQQQAHGPFEEEFWGKARFILLWECQPNVWSKPGGIPGVCPRGWITPEVA
jgi:hypothetical protein